jgi:uncharacterized membrane protein YraQ (UPF0718 family)
MNRYSSHVLAPLWELVVGPWRFLLIAAVIGAVVVGIATRDVGAICAWIGGVFLLAALRTMVVGAFALLGALIFAPIAALLALLGPTLTERRDAQEWLRMPLHEAA